MCCSIATRNCNHNLFELISIHQLLNCNKRLQYVIATQPAISAKSQKTRVYTVMLCIWVKNQPYMQTRSAWHVVEVVHPGWVRAPDLRPGVWPACGAQGCESLRQSSGSVPVRDWFVCRVGLCSMTCILWATSWRSPWLKSSCHTRLCTSRAPPGATTAVTARTPATNWYWCSVRTPTA